MRSLPMVINEEEYNIRDMITAITMESNTMVKEYSTWAPTGIPVKIWSSAFRIESGGCFLEPWTIPSTLS